MASFPQTLIDNPVAEAELSYQQRSGDPAKWRRWPQIFALGLILALISALCLLFAPQIAMLLSVPVFDLRSPLLGWFSTITILMGGLIMIHQLSFSRTALTLASTSITREKQGRTWESLLLTGFDARRIILGKWSATMRTLWQVYRPLLALRFALGAWMGLSSLITHRLLDVPTLISTLLICGVTAIFPVCYAAFMVTLGLLASLLVASEAAAQRIALFFQFASVVVSISLIMLSIALSFVLPFTGIDSGVISFLPALFVTPLDGGSLALIGMAGNSRETALFYLIGLILSVAVYGALTWAILRCAQMLAVRQRALPPI
jgi:hypothetical protein